MTETELYKRFEKLSLVLSLARNKGYFSALQLICLHRERAAIFHALDEITHSNEEACTPEYQLPAHLETKLNRVLTDFK